MYRITIFLSWLYLESLLLSRTNSPYMDGCSQLSRNWRLILINSSRLLKTIDWPVEIIPINREFTCRTLDSTDKKDSYFRSRELPTNIMQLKDVPNSTAPYSDVVHLNILSLLSYTDVYWQCIRTIPAGSQISYILLCFRIWTCYQQSQGSKEKFMHVHLSTLSCTHGWYR